MTLTSDAALLYLWDRRTLYLGPLAESLEVTQAAATLVLGIDQDFALEVAGELICCRSALLPAGSSVRLQVPKTRLAVCYLDPFGEDFRKLCGQMNAQHGGVYLQLEQELSWIARLLELLHTEASPVQAYALLEQLVGPDAADASVLKVDPRILVVVELIKRDVADNLSAQYLAAQVSLSEPRLLQLFKETIGVPIRRYRQWHRLFVTAAGVTQGLSLTAAALEAGFADSAHFSHTFHSILGMKPSAILSPRLKIRMHHA
ncbi:MAG: helix-turn-helix domain-containing protein [Pseudomonadaceae bacterium]|nr:helix-turn-helix domain-containing protein [Pseudomonadaceae bacterium]